MTYCILYLARDVACSLPGVWQASMVNNKTLETSLSERVTNEISMFVAMTSAFDMSNVTGTTRFDGAPVNDVVFVFRWVKTDVVDKWTAEHRVAIVLRRADMLYIHKVYTRTDMLHLSQWTQRIRHVKRTCMDSDITQLAVHYCICSEWDFNSQSSRMTSQTHQTVSVLKIFNKNLPLATVVIMIMESQKIAVSYQLTFQYLSDT